MMTMRLVDTGNLEKQLTEQTQPGKSGGRPVGETSVFACGGGRHRAPLACAWDLRETAMLVARFAELPDSWRHDCDCNEPELPQVAVPLEWRTCLCAGCQANAHRAPPQRNSAAAHRRVAAGQVVIFGAR